MRETSVLVLVALAACAAAPEDQSVPQLVSDLPTSDGSADANSGWSNSPIPQHHNDTVTIEFEAYPYSNGELIDAVIGFSSQKADAFTDLGPIVRFNPNGYVDARNGSAYAASTTYRYTPNTGYIFRLVIDLYAKRYSVDIKLEDTRVADTWHRIATNFAFRTEQQALDRIDNVARFVDSPTGTIVTTTFAVTPDICISGSPGWVAFPFPTQTEYFTIQVDVTPNPHTYQTLDAVIGLARYHPRRFTDLAAILRFRPDGYMDARDGSAYRTDAPEEYQRYNVSGAHRVLFNVDHRAKRYSVYVRDLYYAHGGWPQAYVANNYAYRTEQSSVATLGWIGAYVDGPGTIRFCNVSAFDHY